jgi:hypothetical protein
MSNSGCKGLKNIRARKGKGVDGFVSMIAGNGKQNTLLRKALCCVYN